MSVEHPFGTLKSWLGATHLLTKTLDRASTEMSLHVNTYNLKRELRLLGKWCLDGRDEDVMRLLRPDKHIKQVDRRPTTQ